MWQWVGMSAVCGVACTASINWYFGSAREDAVARIPIADQSLCVFLFDGADLVSSTASADVLLSEQKGDTDWDSLRQALIDRFPTFPADAELTLPAGPTVIASVHSNDPWRVLIERLNDAVRVELVATQPPVSDQLLAGTETGELSTLRHVTQNAPYPIWHADGAGNILWHNPAYEAVYARARGQAPSPTAPLFDDMPEDGPDTYRSKLVVGDGIAQEWYDVTRLPHDGGHVFYANDVTPVVSAETAQRNFVQTLAKTFAQLSIGLAIFDRNMQLVLFNPALTDLTALPPDFLSAKPNLLSFFDRLRDARVMPEPKDYNSWREQMTAMVAQANDGRYTETWALPSGATYRVTGRPHPDGAVAFLFEDISAEMSLTRRFRADLELNQNILDALDDAVVVFSNSGTLTVSNRAYCSLWQIDPDSSFADIGIIDTMRDWQRLGGSNPLWGELRDFILGQDNRMTWSAPVTLTDGRGFDCVIHPMQHGATLVRFVPTPSLPGLIDHAPNTALA